MTRFAPCALALALALVACSSSPDETASASPATPRIPLMGNCESQAPADTLRAKRDACTFVAGAKVSDTLGFTTTDRSSIPIKHVIVMMKENRSFDQILGKIATSGQPDADGIPAGFTNPDLTGAPVAPFHQTNSCFASDPNHQFSSMHKMFDGGKMDGFVTNAANTTDEAAGKDGRFVMGYFEPSDLPFYYFLASTFALGDRHFPSALSGTFSNRNFLLLATAAGIKNTLDAFPDGYPTILDSLDKAGVSWGAYVDGSSPPFEFTLGWLANHDGVHPLADMLAALADGSLPAVSFVDGSPDGNDEHPNADVQAGEAWSRAIYEAAIQSPLWPSLALFYTYDEAGGFFDHVPPPTSCVADDADTEFTELGIRVPLVVISPWARPHAVSHEVHQHTSITRFIEALFDLPAMTARDANSDAMLDMFDFACKPDTPVPGAPEAGTGACQK